MKRKCESLGTLFLVLGIIGAIVLAYNYGFVTDVDYSVYSGYSFDKERSESLTTAIFVAGTFFSYVIYVIFKALAEILGKIDVIMNNMNKKNDELKEMIQAGENSSDNLQELYNDLPEL